MPETTPVIKVNAVKDLGARVILTGTTHSEAEAHAKKLARQRRMSLIHPYDDPEVIDGQGTIAMEILRQHSPPLDAAAMYQSIKKKRRVYLDTVGTFADEAAVRRVGKETFALGRRYVDEIVLVSTD